MIELAILSESTADEKGLLAFARGIVDRECSLSEPYVFRSRGWPAVLKEIRPVVASLASWAHPAALLVVADGNGSPVDANHPQCRVSLLHKVAGEAEARFRQAGREVPVLVGVAYPSIEAWWLAHADFRMGELAWSQRGRAGGVTYQKPDLKRALYGSEFVSLAEMERRQVEAGSRAAEHADMLSDRFPVGLASLIRGLRALDQA